VVYARRVRVRVRVEGDGGFEAREERTAEPEIQLEPERYRQLFEWAPDAYLVTDRAGRIQQANVAASQLLGVPTDELIGTSVLQFVPADGKERVLARISALRRATSIEEWEDVVTRDGSEPVTVSFRVGSGGPDTTGALRWLLRDVTESRRGREMLRQSELRLKMLHTVKDTFLQSVSHDLRSPLAAVIGLAQTLVREDAHLAQEEIDELLHRILHSAYQMKALLTDLLDLDRLRGGHLGTMDDLVDLDALAAGALRQLEARKQRAVELQPSGLVARIDKSVLERILVNLLDNALRYTAPQGQVWFGFESADKVDLILRVDDDGPGIEEGSKEAIFDPFVRVGAPSAVAGTGVGLALVERFARLLGGRAWVEDRAGGGSSFKVLFPGCLTETLPAQE
jgi:PAS domain S-box-containing protein